LERRQEEREIQRKKKLIELKLKLNKGKTKAINGQGSRQTSRRTSVNGDGRSVDFDRPKINEWLSNYAKDNQQIPTNIPSHREEDFQRENFNALTKYLACMLARSSVGGDIDGEKMASFYHSIQNVNKNLWVYTGGKCVAIAKVLKRQSGRSGFYVAVGSG
jgi:hypothetical protein